MARAVEARVAAVLAVSGVALAGAAVPSVDVAARRAALPVEEAVPEVALLAELAEDVADAAAQRAAAMPAEPVAEGARAAAAWVAMVVEAGGWLAHPQRRPLPRRRLP